VERGWHRDFLHKVEAVPYDLTGGRLYGRDPAETGERGFAAKPLGIISQCGRALQILQTRGCQATPTYPILKRWLVFTHVSFALGGEAGPRGLPRA
jgi:hypothetical protein